MLENVAFFCESGGLDAIKDCFESDKSEMPITLASCFISIIAQVSTLQYHCYLSLSGFLASTILCNRLIGRSCRNHLYVKRQTEFLRKLRFDDGLTLGRTVFEIYTFGSFTQVSFRKDFQALRLTVSK